MVTMQSTIVPVISVAPVADIVYEIVPVPTKLVTLRDAISAPAGRTKLTASVSFWLMLFCMVKMLLLKVRGVGVTVTVVVVNGLKIYAAPDEANELLVWSFIELLDSPFAPTIT